MSAMLAFLSCRLFFPATTAALHRRFITPTDAFASATMPKSRRGKKKLVAQPWKEKPVSDLTLKGLEISDDTSSSSFSSPSFTTSQFDAVASKYYSTASGVSTLVAPSVAEKDSVSQGLSKLFTKGPLGSDFNVDENTFSRAKIRATFYPKFENEKSDQEIRTRMIELVSYGQGALEVSLKHSGSLFMYAGHNGGAYAKNSFGNIYTAVGVFVLARTFREAWGTQASRKQEEFNEFLEKNHMCISMELVTAVLGDHGQRPIDDYVVVTAVTELGHGKPKFYSTPELIAFCRKWRLTTNHVWLFSSRKSASSFFAAYDALCEEGTATPVCQTLNEVAEISVPGSKDHVNVQGEILEGLVARIVSPDSSDHMAKILGEYPPPLLDGIGQDFGPSLREVCAANRSDEKQQIKALLYHTGASMCPNFSDWFGDEISGGHSKNADQSVLSKFLQAHPADFSTTKLQEMIRLIRQRHFRTAFKSYCDFQKIDSLSSDNLHFKMVIHVYNDSVFRRYQQEMRKHPSLWPLYRGFFVDINLFKMKGKLAPEILKESSSLVNNLGENNDSSLLDGLANEDANLMVKLKFLTYKLRTFLIRNGLSTLFKDGPQAYKAYYMKQMKTWNTSPGKQKELSKMLDEWAIYITRKCGNKQLSSSTYLTEAEAFLEQYANRSPENRVLVGSSGNFIGSERFLAIIEAEKDEEGDLHTSDISPSRSPHLADTVNKDGGLIVFFPGIPGCAKSALCKELMEIPGGLGDNRQLHSLMGDQMKGKYWPMVNDKHKKNPYAVILADKNAPNVEVWEQIENMCRNPRASAVPVIPDSEGSDSNPFSLDALAVFLFRVLNRVNHPGRLDKDSTTAGYVLLMFYHLYDGKTRRDFETELSERFGALVKMPLLKPERGPLPDPVKAVLEEGIYLFNLHWNKHGRLESSKGAYAKEWIRWEKRVREVLFGNANYLNSIQVPFEYAVQQVLDQLKAVVKGEYRTPISERRNFGNIVYAAVTMPVNEICGLLNEIAKKDPKAKDFLEDKDFQNTLTKAHVTLAHKKSHGVATVASYSIFLKRSVPVDIVALLFSDKLAALEVQMGLVDGETVSSKNAWPHITIWTAAGVPAKEANALPQLLSEGGATRIDFHPPATVVGTVDFY